MKLSNLLRFIGFAFFMALGSWSSCVQAQEFRYHYVSIFQLQLPPGITLFAPVGVTDQRILYGYAATADNGRYPAFSAPSGPVTTIPVPGGFINAMNKHRVMVGGVITDETHFGPRRAAYFVPGGVQYLPAMPAEYESVALDVNDHGDALVAWIDGEHFETHFYVYRNGVATPLQAPPRTNLFPEGFNNHGSVIGQIDNDRGSFGIRFDVATGKIVILDVPAADRRPFNATQAADLNNRDHAAGYAFVEDAQAPEGFTRRVVLWDTKGRATAFFTEEHEPLPLRSGRLLLSDNDEIVSTSYLPVDIFQTWDRSYLHPRPGVRLDLEDLVIDKPAGRNFKFVIGVNANGDMVGYSEANEELNDIFFMQRLSERETAAPASTPARPMLSEADWAAGKAALARAAAAPQPRGAGFMKGLPALMAQRPPR